MKLVLATTVIQMWEWTSAHHIEICWFNAFVDKFHLNSQNGIKFSFLKTILLLTIFQKVSRKQMTIQIHISQLEHVRPELCAHSNRAFWKVYRSLMFPLRTSITRMDPTAVGELVKVWKLSGNLPPLILESTLSKSLLFLEFILHIGALSHISLRESILKKLFLNFWIVCRSPETSPGAYIFPEVLRVDRIPPRCSFNFFEKAFWEFFLSFWIVRRSPEISPGVCILPEVLQIPPRRCNISCNLFEKAFWEFFLSFQIICRSPETSPGAYIRPEVLQVDRIPPCCLYNIFEKAFWKFCPSFRIVRRSPEIT